MKYTKNDAKAYARENMQGIWAAALTPFNADLSIDEAGLRSNIRHWVDDLEIQGLFVAGKQGEFFSMSLEERKRNIQLAVDECGGKAGVIASVSDQNMNTALELAHYAQDCGADYIVVHAPVLSFVHDRSEVLYQYYKRFCDELDIGIAMWSHPDSGYLMQPDECARIAELPNIMAIKYSVPRDMYVQLSRMIGDKIHVSTSLEDDWLDNIEELDWKLYLCSSPPYQLQTANDKRMHEYTQLAFEGKLDAARKVRDSLDPVRAAMANSRPAGKPTAFGKYWQELLGQVGGPVRAPMLDLTAAEKAAVQRAFDGCGLKI
ncbi:dihydrodipicolinate synthase family protein [Sulfitobacter sp. M57]|uniref:dihydrodipicolinate synthase family protein n=1 Tax=unclassified Sulfitobacter TaxID=196795 RepID=UPI0023E1704E|nr:MULTISPECIES: dihydrodipicolinate synthase family protein [unclassified Sulfitobacter]MDF3416528.1 dihydrodipicolinate synthase family protein [Sulfitobacter sp. KE5]MDF3424032.1 dihydrodipicolinate synthase family protein [Sulfitobacter sp. KE43]MDF3435018.1 dihydrodipicolinate synthase family protein [Sulfitobacter sp. KE42]MDF3460663.1 dihydrodipicolinate synthase family protein [Sulfitobacter sp. S74]MDF3464617.1 dihydrodipicolinate synthase family protein [Sulfitobacter sp. Ks18]